MRVPVEESKVQELAQTALDAVLEEYAQRLVGFERTLRGAPCAFLPVHHQHPRRGESAVDARDLYPRVVREVPLEIPQVIRLLHEIELLQKLLRELVHEQRRGASDVLAAPIVEDAFRRGSKDPQI